MSEQNTNTPFATQEESLQQGNLALCEYQAQPSKDESEVTAMTSLSEADSVDQTSFACGEIQTEDDKGNLLDEPHKVEDDGIYPEMPVQLEVSACMELMEAAPRIESVPTSQPIGSHPVLDELRVLLGNKVILIPIPQGKKGPVIKGWQAIKLPQTKTAHYQQALSVGNIGVLLGAPSDGLSAIDIDADGELEGFLALNPMLRETLITKGARGAQIWCKIKGDCPVNGG
jgi:Bifunctional DNA primase/polymerase, N-terminal